VLLVSTIYFVAITLAIYHLQQQELDRIQLQMDENSRVLDRMQSYLYINSTKSSVSTSVQRSEGLPHE
jgi:hypothetical protein